MDQTSMVDEQTKSGRQFVDLLKANGFEVHFAFWAKPTDAEKWYLYLCSPIVDRSGPQKAYLEAQNILRAHPELWIDPFELKLVGLNDSLTADIKSFLEPQAKSRQAAITSASPHQGMTRYGGASLGGVSMDEALIYPPFGIATSP